MALELITIRELLKDPQYREFFRKVPKLPDHITPDNKPWQLLVKKEGETHWRSKRFGTYAEAFAGFKKMLPVIQDAAINCPGYSFMPPIRNVRIKGKFVTVRGGGQRPYIKTLLWKPKITDDMSRHEWCPYCRRPSVFTFATTKPRSRGGFILTETEPTIRCIICGASDRIVNFKRPDLNQKWDPNRPKIYNL